MAKLLLVLLIICCFSNLVLSFQCLPQKGCDLLKEAYKDPHVHEYYDKMDESKRNVLKGIYNNHCVDHLCTLDVGCSNIAMAKSHFPKDMSKLPPNLQEILKQIRDVFHDYCGVNK